MLKGLTVVFTIYNGFISFLLLQDHIATAYIVAKIAAFHIFKATEHKTNPLSILVISAKNC